MPALLNLRPMLLAAAIGFLSACGGAGAGIESAPAPAPSPSPSPSPGPSPTPPSFQPIAATVFQKPLYNPQLASVGKAWQHEFEPNKSGALNVRDADGFSISYEQGSSTYQIAVPLAGSGTLMRTGEYGTYSFGEWGAAPASGLPVFPADPKNKNPTNYCCNALSIVASDRSQSQYSYVSLADIYAAGPAGSNTIAYGTFAFGQPTITGDVPVTGTASYNGNVLGHFAGDAGATWLEGSSRFEFDFAQALLTGEIALTMRCMMGCSYNSVTYALTDTHFARGSALFSGSLTTSGAPSNGSFSGMFAGPAAVEMMSQFQLPFFNPEYQQWMTAGGAIIGKRN